MTGKESIPLGDPESAEVAPEEEQGMTVEDAYRHLAGMPPEPVEVEEEI